MSYENLNEIEQRQEPVDIVFDDKNIMIVEHADNLPLDELEDCQ